MKAIFKPSLTTSLEKYYAWGAALRVCKKLFEMEALRDYLLPPAKLKAATTLSRDDLSKREVPAVADLMGQVLELHTTHRPKVLHGHWGSACAPTTLAAYRISVNAEPRDREYADFALFLEADLDEVLQTAVTELYLDKGRQLKLSLVPEGKCKFDVKQLRDAKLFQEMIFSLTLNAVSKRLGHPVVPAWDRDCLYLTLPVISYATSPLKVDWRSLELLINEVVPLSPQLSLATQDDCMKEAGVTRKRPGESGNPIHLYLSNGQFPLDSVQNSLVETVHNRNLYLVIDLLWDMDGYSAFGHKPQQFATYMDYYKERYARDLMHPRQQLLKAKPLKDLHNLLVKRPEKKTGVASKRENFVELPAELCRLKVMRFPSKLVNTVSLIPSFMHRFENVSIATQLQKDLQAAFDGAAKVSYGTILQALTTARTAEAFNLERLELLGDSFLKFAVSKRLFLIHEKKGEGFLTSKRQSVISNSSLHYLGVAKKLPMYINDEHFSPFLWNAPGRPSPADCDSTICGSVHALPCGADESNPNQIKCRERHRWLSKLAVADVVEALIGAHLVDGGPEAALGFMEWVRINVHFDESLATAARVRSVESLECVQGQDLSKLESILNYTFHNKSILLEALTHKSYQTPVGSCYQRLEFLGDAVLDYLIASYLYKEFPDIPEGDLTDLKSATASNECFARSAVRHHLEMFLLHGNVQITEQVTKFVTFIQNASTESESLYGWECDKGPKVLGDLVESLAGAVLVDTGFDTSKVWSSFEPLLQPIVTPETLHLHPVRELQELCDREKYFCLYKSSLHGTLQVVTCTVNTGSKILKTEAEKANKTSAKRVAAYQMVKELEDLGCQRPYRACIANVMSKSNLPSAGQANNVEKSITVMDEVNPPASTVQKSSYRESKESLRIPSVANRGKRNADQIVSNEAEKVVQHGQISGGPPLQTKSEQDKINDAANIANQQNASKVVENAKLASIGNEISSGKTVAVEDVGRPRADLNNLCTEYMWKKPSYELCPGYPQGPPHSPRFAFVVKVQCWLHSEGTINPYEIECDGDPMKSKGPARDSAALCAMSWLKHSSATGLTFAKNQC